MLTWFLVGCSTLAPLWSDPLAGPPRPEAVVFEVPRGATASGLTDALVQAQLLADGNAWKVYLRTSGRNCLKAGRHSVPPGVTLDGLMDALCGPPLPEDEPFTVLEGWRLRDTDAALAAKGWIQPGAYIDLATRKAVALPFPVASPTLEGYLYPETYRVVASTFKPEQLILRQLETFQERFLKAHPDGFGQRTLHEVVVMASLLEREEPSPAQRPLVAGILWKRLDSGWKLGVDATSRYTLDDWNDRKAFLKQLRDPKDPYNTRLLDGLPPTAIGAPSLPSLQAALQPQASEFWYYLHDGDKVLHPARNAEEHEANRKRYDVY